MDKYINTILKKSNSKLKKVFDDKQILNKFIKAVNDINAKNKEGEIEQFIKLYNETVKLCYQNRNDYTRL